MNASIITQKYLCSPIYQFKFIISEINIALGIYTSF